jgi:transposase
MTPLHKNAKLKYPALNPDANPPKFKSKSASKNKRRRARKAADPTEGLQVANPNAGAIDIGCQEHWVAVPPGRAQKDVRVFGCCTADLQALVEWLVECKVDTVVMEATGHYWVVLYDLAEEHHLRPVVVNPRYAKNMSGKKGDIPDCQWMQKLHTYGLFANSFRPTEPVRVLRTYMRQRESLVHGASQSIQHMQKALTEMNVQLANVISDISGETGLRIIDAILGGQRDPETLAGLKDRRIKASLRTLAAALQGYWKDEQLFVLEQARLSYSHFQEQILQCDEKIHQHMKELQSRLSPDQAPNGVEAPSTQSNAKVAPFDLKAELRRIVGVDLTAIDGIGPLTAQIVVSEIGTDTSYWPSEKHFASWLGLCPDHRISGGRILGRSTRPVVNRARHALRMAAYTLEHSHSALGAKYRRLKRKLGAPKAIVAMAHHLARLIYRMIKFGQEYVDQGMKAYEEKYRQLRMRWLQKQAAELNLKLVAV